VGIRHGRATVSGEPARATVARLEGTCAEATIREARIPQRERLLTPPREKVGVLNILARAGFTALLVAASAATAAAQSAAPSPSPSPSATPLAEIGRVVTTSDRVAEPIGRTSRPTFVVDRTRIDNYGARTVGDALVDVPGTNLFSYGTFGAQMNYGLRGTTNSSDTLVLIDGVPLTSASAGAVDLGTLPTLGITRIEVVESGGSTLYGTNATGGVINLITGAPAQPYARVSAGSFGDRDVAVGTGLGGFTASIERHVANGEFAYPAFRYSQTEAYAAGTRDNADAEQTAVRLGYDGSLTSAWHVHADAGADAYHLGVPGSLVFGLSTLARQNQNRGNADLTVEHRGSRDTLGITLSGAMQNLAFNDPNQGGESDTDDRRVGVSVKDVRAWHGGDLVAGLDLSRESALLTFTDGTPPLVAAQAQSAAYAQLGADLAPTTRLTFGVRGEHDAPLGSVVVPSVGAITSFGAARLSANYGTTFRVPTLDDLYFPGFSNPSLKPERVRNEDATLAFPSVAGGLSLGWFARHGTNLIAFDANFVPQNVGHSAVEGLQITAATRPFSHVRVGASLTDLYRAVNLDTGARLDFTPNTRATVALDRAFDGGRIAFGARALVVGRSYATTVGQSAFPDAYSTTDVYLRYRLAPATIVTARVRNLGDDRYVPIHGYPAPGRSYVVELSTR